MVVPQDGALQAKLLTWTPGQPPSIVTLGNSTPLPGSAALPGDPLFSAQHGDDASERLSAGQRWNVPLTPAQLNVSGEFTASYASGSNYDLCGTLTVTRQTYRAVGTGTTSSASSPRLVFTQTLCSPNGQSPVPACPRLDWQLNLDLQGTPVGGGRRSPPPGQPAAQPEWPRHADDVQRRRSERRPGLPIEPPAELKAPPGLESGRRFLQ